MIGATNITSERNRKLAFLSNWNTDMDRDCEVPEQDELIILTDKDEWAILYRKLWFVFRSALATKLKWHFTFKWPILANSMYFFKTARRKRNSQLIKTNLASIRFNLARIFWFDFQPLFNPLCVQHFFRNKILAAGAIILAHQVALSRPQIISTNIQNRWCL